MSLCLHLLTDLVPGFRVWLPSRAGRRPDAQAREKRQRLLSEVQSLKHKNSHLTDSAACKNIADRRAGEFHNAKVETLRKQLRRARRERTARNKVLGSMLQRLGEQDATRMFSLSDGTSGAGNLNKTTASKFAGGT
jgi:anti-sigma factor RsiW